MTELQQRPGAGTLLDERIRDDFPILRRRMSGDRALVYLDSANTSQKPRAVIDAERHVYESCYANVHRGVYQLSAQAERAYEGARAKLQCFVNARSPQEIVFVRGTTEAINLVAHSFGGLRVKAGDTVSKGQALLVLEAMKMEHTLAAPADGTVKSVRYAVGEQVVEGAELVEFE